MNTLVITNGTATRMAVIAARTGSELMAGAKAMMIETLKEKLRNGVAHFIFQCFNSFKHLPNSTTATTQF